MPGQASKLGSFLDPLADKVLVISMFLSLTYVNLIPMALASLVISRDVLLIYAGLYIRYMSVEPPVSPKVILYHFSIGSNWFYFSSHGRNIWTLDCQLLKSTLQPLANSIQWLN